MMVRTLEGTHPTPKSHATSVTSCRYRHPLHPLHPLQRTHPAPKSHATRRSAKPGSSAGSGNATISPAGAPLLEPRRSPGLERKRGLPN